MTLKDRISEFVRAPEISVWYNGVDLKLGTKENYAHRLMELFDLMKIHPSEFLKACDSNRKELLGRIKVSLGESRTHRGAAIAHQQRAALVSFVSYHQNQLDEPLTINFKVKLRRVRMKKGLTFEDAEKIIAECTHPYREIFRFLLWSGIDQSTFSYINGNTEILRSVQTQLSDATRDYVRIDLPPRKNNTDVYFLIVPKFAFDNLKLPISTREHRLRDGTVTGGNAITPMKLKKRWRLAAKKAGLYYVGMGAHSLRSAFQTQAVRAHVDDRMLQFQMGRGADKYGYVRPDESDVAKELRKLWAFTKPITTQDFESQRNELVSLKRELYAGEMQKLERELNALSIPMYVTRRDGSPRPLKTREETTQEVIRIKKAMGELADKLKALG
jgi:hypothetical protein